MTDKLTQLTTNVARLLDSAMALPADADREQATQAMAYDLLCQIRAVLPGAFKPSPVPDELWIAGFTIGYCDDGSAYLQADNRPGEEGVSVRIDHLSEALSALYEAALAEQTGYKVQVLFNGQPVGNVPDSMEIGIAIDALDIPDDIATRVISREVSFEADNDCGDACKI